MLGDPMGQPNGLQLAEMWSKQGAWKHISIRDWLSCQKCMNKRLTKTTQMAKWMKKKELNMWKQNADKKKTIVVSLHLLIKQHKNSATQAQPCKGNVCFEMFKYGFSLVVLCIFLVTLFLTYLSSLISHFHVLNLVYKGSERLTQAPAWVLLDFDQSRKEVNWSWLGC